MRAALLAATWALVACAERAAPITACDQLVITARAVAACPTLDRKKRDQAESSSRALADALDRLEQAGPGAGSAAGIEAARQLCEKQDAALRQRYAQAAPACLR